MKQRLGEKKQKYCEAISGKKYRVCYTRGGWPHGEAQCWFGDGDMLSDADTVNYHTGVWEPAIRAGQAIKPELLSAFRTLRP